MTCELVVDGTVDGKDNKEENTDKLLTLGIPGVSGDEFWELRNGNGI